MDVVLYISRGTKKVSYYFLSEIPYHHIPHHIQPFSKFDPIIRRCGEIKVFQSSNQFFDYSVIVPKALSRLTGDYRAERDTEKLTKHCRGTSSETVQRGVQN